MPALSRAFRTRGPMVFVNACEVGRPHSGARRNGGFAAAIIATGGRCVIAPLWSVEPRSRTRSPPGSTDASSRILSGRWPR